MDFRSGGSPKSQMSNESLTTDELSNRPACSEPSVSVALCTYNGACYLREQLASILRQELLPNEVVICDDCSSDETPTIIEEFATSAKFEVRWTINQTNMRSTKNFEKAISLCKGDLIVLSDQDDVWETHKLSNLVDTLKSNPKAGFVFSDAMMTDHLLRPLPYSLWDAVGFDLRAKERVLRGGLYSYLLARFCVTGATMAFWSRYRDLVLPIPATWVHDAWIALLIAAVDDGCFTPMRLIKYRQHTSQQIGEKKRNLFQQFKVARGMSVENFRKVVQDFGLALGRLKDLNAVSPQRLAMLEEKIEHFQTRCDMRDTKGLRLASVMQEVVSGRYTKYSLGWKSAAQDLLLS